MPGPSTAGPGAAGLADRLIRWAREAGFDRAGVASLEPLEHGPDFERWLERGDHAGMDYLERRVEVRREPARILEGARSVLCVALQYHPLRRQGDEGRRCGEGGEGGAGAGGIGAGEPAAAGETAGGAGAEEPPPEGDLWPRVARYARGRDYHNLMGKRLKKLARRIRREVPGADTRVYVDTGPVLERELAARAGLGVPGKNTNLLSRELGSWFLLGEIFTTLDLAPPDPIPRSGQPPGSPPAGGGEPSPGPAAESAVADLCGRCTLCLEACPTGALPEPYRLDSNRCISYWTIEHRGPLPPAMREAVGDWVFGCDVCQEVCPWNLRYHGRADRGGREPADHPDLRLPPHRRELDLRGLLALGRGEYEERFRGSAMKRARLEGLKRNAAVAMGNRGDGGYVPALVRALAEEEDGVVRGHVAWALGRLLEGGVAGGVAEEVAEEARGALRRAAEGDPDPEVRREAEGALEVAGGGAVDGGRRGSVSATDED